MNKIVLLSTGGTIAMRDSGAGAVVSLAADDFAKMLPAGTLTDLAIEPQALSSKPSAHRSVPELWEMRNAVVKLLARADVAGVVVTHGTDTMEETAYLFDLTIASEKPVVITGSMRTADQPGYDGSANVASAVKVAGDPGARGCGCLIVMNEQAHTARYVVKTHATALDAFESPRWGPVARLSEGEITWAFRPNRQAPVIPAKLEPDVHLIKSASGADDTIVGCLVEKRVRGIVVEAFGSARVPLMWIEPLTEAVRQGTKVVVVSRTGAGRAVDRYAYAGAYKDLKNRGIEFMDDLSGPKARIALMVRLGAG